MLERQQNGAVHVPAQTVSFSLHALLSTNVTAEWADFRVDLRNVTWRRVICLSRSSLELQIKWPVCLSVAGDRHYNIPALSPLLVPEIDVSQGTGLKLKMKDVKVFGLLGASVEKMK